MHQMLNKCWTSSDEFKCVWVLGKDPADKGHREVPVGLREEGSVIRGTNLKVWMTYFLLFLTECWCLCFFAYKISFVSLQSEEFHIYTQYCTNYPRYDLEMRKCYFCVPSYCFKSVGPVYMVVGICAWHWAAYDGKTVNVRRTNHRGTQILIHPGIGSPQQSQWWEDLWKTLKETKKIVRCPSLDNQVNQLCLARRLIC